MCANYEPIARIHAQLLNLLEPIFEYKSDLYPDYGDPILVATEHGIEWLSARFGLVPNWVDDMKKVKNTYIEDAEKLIIYLTYSRYSYFLFPACNNSNHCVYSFLQPIHLLG